MSSLRNSYYKIANVIPINRVRRLSDDGTGITGEINMNGDYSVTSKDFWIQPPVGSMWILQEVGLVLDGVANGQLVDYGDIAGGLTNGIRFFLEVEGQEFDVTGSSNFKNNSDMISNGARFNGMVFGGNQRLDSVWFPQIPDTEVIELDADRNMKFIVRLSDDFTALTEHGFYMRAEDYGQKAR